MQFETADHTMAYSKEHLDEILKKLKKKIASIREALALGEQEIEGMHEYYWQNYTEMDQYGYENFDNQQALLNQVNANQAMQKSLYRLERMVDSPYFGRVDFLFEGEEEPEPFYIGIGSFSERRGEVPLIYDWRAPVSGLFYDYDSGPARYEAPAGTVEGSVTSKWQYKIRRGRLVYAFETDMKIDDEILRGALGEGGDTSLRNIVRTIQREQNAIIRNTGDRILVIQGVAGSGKTSIALHRIAYLLYHDRMNLKSSNVLVLSPNSVFSDYISHVLPELGEENIQEMSLDLFAWKELTPYVDDCEDRYDEIERALAQEASAGVGGQAGGQKVPGAETGVRSNGRTVSVGASGQAEGKEKTAGGIAGQTDAGGVFGDRESAGFLADLREYVLLAEDELMQFRDFSFHKFQKPADQIEDLFYNRFPEIPVLSRMGAIMEYSVDEYETLTGKNFVQEDLEEIRQRFERMYRTTDVYLLYADFLEKYGYGHLERLPKEKRHLEYRDVYPMLYMKYLLLGTPSQSRIRHLVVDEMQDYTYLQYLLLEMLFHCRMTILGDRCQTMDSLPRDVTSFLPKVFGKQIRVLRLDKSYRNTVEIASYAAAIQKEETVDLFERHGSPVVHYDFLSFEEAVRKIREDCAAGNPGAVTQMSSGDALGEPVPEQDWVELRKPEPGQDVDELRKPEQDVDDPRKPEPGWNGDASRIETVAVLTATMHEAKEAYRILSQMQKNSGSGIPVALVDRDSTRFCRGITVTTYYFAKGLEFDRVCYLKDRKLEQLPLRRQAEYISATRAMHQLGIYRYH